MKLSVVSLALLATSVSAGPLAYAACQGGCATIVMACYAAGGATWGMDTADDSRWNLTAV